MEKQDEKIIVYVNGTTTVIDSKDIYDPFPKLQRDSTDEKEEASQKIQAI